MNAPFVAHNPSNAADPFNYIRPTNQVVLLLSRDHSFPPFPLELAGSIDEKEWYTRMDALHYALHKTWHWAEKAMFAFAFIASIAMPWPIIGLISRYMGSDGNSWVDGDGSSSSSVVSSAIASASTFATPSLTPAAASTSSASSSTAAPSLTAAAASQSAKFLLRARQYSGPQASTTSAWSDRDSSDGYYDYAGNGYWQDNFTDGMRWAAIATLLGLLIVAWAPWMIYSIRNNRRLTNLLKQWNESDEKLGTMRALFWNLDKAPAFSNAKLLTITLPPTYRQQPSIFHSNAYPPSYGFGNGTNLPGYGDGSAVLASGGPAMDGKKDWMEPPTFADPHQNTGAAHNYGQSEAYRRDESDFATNQEQDNMDTVLADHNGTALARHDSVASYATMRTAPMSARQFQAAPPAADDVNDPNYPHNLSGQAEQQFADSHETVQPLRLTRSSYHGQNADTV